VSRPPSPLRFAVGTAIVWLMASCAWAADLVQYHYSLNADWSDVANPNGVWSYNHGDVPIKTYQTFWWGQAGWGYYSNADGSILKGSPESGKDHDWLLGDVVMHSLSRNYGGATTFLNVKWTSPADGVVDIAGRAWEAEIYADRDVRWTLSVAGQTVAARGSVQGLYRTDAGAQFAANVTAGSSLQNIPVNVGDVVQFSVMSEQGYGHFVGVEENITLTVVPEPGVGALLVAGGAALGMMRRCRQRESGRGPLARMVE